MDSYIEFPGLGIKLPISDTIVSFGSFSLKWYGLLIAIGFILAVLYGLKRAKHFDLDPDRMIDVVLVSTIAAFIGARLYFIFFSSPEVRSAYFEDPLMILQVWKGGLGIYGGIIFAFLCAILMCRIRKVKLLAMFDIASLGFLIGQAIGRWGNFFNQEAFGGVTKMAWRMNGDIIMSGSSQGLSGALSSEFYTMYAEEIGEMGRTEALKFAGVHPTFLYESLWCILGFVLLHLMSKKLYKFKGQIFCFYLMWYGAGRFFIEQLRADSLYIGEMKISVLVSGLAVVGGFVMLMILQARAKASPVDLFASPGILLDEDGDGEADESGPDGEKSSEDGEKSASEDSGEDANTDKIPSEAETASETGAEESPEEPAPDDASEADGASAADDASETDGGEKEGSDTDGDAH